MPPFECNKIKSVSLVEKERSKEYYVSPVKGETPTYVDKAENIRNLFKIDPIKTNDKKECEELEYKLYTLTKSFVYEEVKNDPLVKIDLKGDLTITKAQAKETAK